MTRKPGHFDREFDLSGGILCLDFANTLGRRKIPGQTTEHLREYSDLVAFAKQSRVVTPQYARELLAAGLIHPKEATQVLRAALVLREAVYRVFATFTQKLLPDRKDLKLIEQFATEAMRHRRLASAGHAYRWEWRRDASDIEMLSYILWPIAQSATDLLTSDRIKRMRECHAPTCAWLFLDESRNRSRRWCDMSVCGNRQKARRHYERVKS